MADGSMRHLTLTSTDNARLKEVVHLRKPRRRRETGLLVAEGWREVERGVAAGLKVRELFHSPELLRTDEQGLRIRLPRLEESDPWLVQLPPMLLQKITYHAEPEGILAVMEQPAWDLDALAGVENPLWLVANGINKPGNLGAMARTASAAGVTGLIAADADVDTFNPNAIRASTGAVFTLPIFTMDSPAAIQWLKQHGIRIAAAVVNGYDIHSSGGLTGPLAIVIGREETGLAAPWIEAADLRLTIPTVPGVVDSLNASNAAAIFLFEARRQRRDKA